MSGKEYVIRNVRLRIPEDILTPPLEQAFSSGRYEHLEANQIPRILKHNDRVLELGGGVGYLSILASITVQLDACYTVEANPDLIPIIKENHRLNNVSVETINAAALSRKTQKLFLKGGADSIAFYRRKNFWGSSLSPLSPYEDTVDLKVIDFQALIDRTQPTVLVVDIEGGEVDLFDRIDLSGIRSVLLEVHKSVTGLDGIDKVYRDLRAEGFQFDPDCSVGAIMHFTSE